MTEKKVFIIFFSMLFLLVLFMLIALLLIPAGLALIVYTEKVVDFIGKIDFAERIFIGGGTYTFVKLFGVLLMIGSFMYMTGGLQSVFGAIFGPIFNM